MNVPLRCRNLLRVIDHIARAIGEDNVLTVFSALSVYEASYCSSQFVTLIVFANFALHFILSRKRSSSR